MSSTTPVAVPTTIDHLDFDPVCQMFSRRAADGERVPCTSSATWYVVLRHHCIPDQPQHLFLCEDHFERMNARKVWLCPACEQSFVALSNVIRTERIR